MANTAGAKKSRCSNWSHEETMVLAELKKEAFLNKKEGGFVWKHIAQTISGRFPDQKRSHDQCRRRWETLGKTYKHIEYYCVETGQDHWELDDDELSSMKLDTAYRRDWYNIVKEVCSQRKRKEESDCELQIAVKRSKRSDTCSSPTTVLPEPTPGRESLYVTPPASICEPIITTLDTNHEQSTTINGQTSIWPSLEVEKPSPEEEIRRLKRQNDDLILELAQLRQNGQNGQNGQVTQQNQAEQAGIGWEVMVPHSRSLSPECSSHGQPWAAMNLAGCSAFDPLDSFTYFDPFILSFHAMELYSEFDLTRYVVGNSMFEEAYRHYLPSRRSGEVDYYL